MNTHKRRIMAFSMPVVPRRGAGLGYELMSWSKAFIGSQVLGVQLLHPAWGFNRRGYAKYFGTARTDWAIHTIMRAVLPTYYFTEADYRDQFPLDFPAAVARFAKRHDLMQRTGFVICFHGNWGGFNAITLARDFVRSQLLSARNSVSNLYETMRRFPVGNIRVGIHIRRGDFNAPMSQNAYRSNFNTAIPISWYQMICQSLRTAFGERVSFLVISDADERELAPLITEIGAITTFDIPLRDISDLLALSCCDLAVCSISNFSMWAVFLSNQRYLWFSPNLTVSGTLGSIWGFEVDQQSPNSETEINRRRISARLAAGEQFAPRAIPVGLTGDIPGELLCDLERRVRDRLLEEETDLIKFGVVPMPQVPIRD
jgi:Glycosyl transferase family 11